MEKNREASLAKATQKQQENTNACSEFDPEVCLEKVEQGNNATDHSETDQPFDQGNASPKQYQDSDEGLINEITDHLLPNFNEAIRNYILQLGILDPLDLGDGVEMNAGSVLSDYFLTCFGCTHNITELPWSLGNLVGISKFGFRDFDIISGSERTNSRGAFGCRTIDWYAGFDFDIRHLGDRLALDDMSVGTRTTSCCGRTRNATLEGGIQVFDPFLKGRVTLNGTLFDQTAIVTFASVSASFDLGIGRLDPYIQDLPFPLNVIVDWIVDYAANRYITPYLRCEYDCQIELNYSPFVEPSMYHEVTIPAGEALRMHAGFMRRNLQRQVAAAYHSVATFFGFGGDN